MVSEEQAKFLFKRYEDKCRECEAFIPAHVEAVVRTVRWMAEVDLLNSDEAAAAGWLHDIGYSAGQKEGHAEAGLKICEDEGLALSEAQIDAILNHGTVASPTTDLGRLMKKADKLSMLDFELLKLFYPRGLKLLKKIWLPTIAAVIEEQ